MRTAVAALLIALVGVLASEPAEAHRTRTRVSVGVGFGYPFWGPPFWGPWYYPPPYYYYPPPRPAEPPVYIERIDPAESGSWYYCEEGKGYYPYVKECPAGVLTVVPLKDIVEIPAGGAVEVTMKVQVAADVPAACSDLVFPLTYSGRAKHA